tara:strand:- start:2 stop:217 length:216 start_codon:yes stop_codon:yes gene_type:complete
MDKLNEQPADSNPLEHVVMRQYRHNEQNEYCVDYGDWSEWAECDIIKFNDINRYIAQGCKYETRELVVKAT